MTENKVTKDIKERPNEKFIGEVSDKKEVQSMIGNFFVNHA